MYQQYYPDERLYWSNNLQNFTLYLPSLTWKNYIVVKKIQTSSGKMVIDPQSNTRKFKQSS